MEIYTPAFRKIKELIEIPVLKYIGEKIVVSSLDLNRYIYNLKKEKEENDEDYELIDFTFSSPYSSQVDELLFDLVRKCIVEETEDGYKLTPYGYELIEEKL